MFVAPSFWGSAVSKLQMEKWGPEGKITKRTLYEVRAVHVKLRFVSLLIFFQDKASNLKIFFYYYSFTKDVLQELR